MLPPENGTWPRSADIGKDPKHNSHRIARSRAETELRVQTCAGGGGDVGDELRGFYWEGGWG